MKAPYYSGEYQKNQGNEPERAVLPAVEKDAKKITHVAEKSQKEVKNIPQPPEAQWKHQAEAMREMGSRWWQWMQEKIEYGLDNGTIEAEGEEVWGWLFGARESAISAATKLQTFVIKAAAFERGLLSSSGEADGEGQESAAFSLSEEDEAILRRWMESGISEKS